MQPSLELATATPQAGADGDRTTFALTEAQARLRQMALDTVRSPHTRRNYGKALDDLFRSRAAGR